MAYLELLAHGEPTPHSRPVGQDHQSTTHREKRTMNVEKVADRIEAFLIATGYTCPDCGKIRPPRDGDLGEEQTETELEPLEVPAEQPVPA